MEIVWTGLASWLLTSFLGAALVCAAATREKKEVHRPVPGAPGTGADEADARGCPPAASLQTT